MKMNVLFGYTILLLVKQGYDLVGLHLQRLDVIAPRGVILYDGSFGSSIKTSHQIIPMKFIPSIAKIVFHFKLT